MKAFTTLTLTHPPRGSHYSMVMGNVAAQPHVETPRTGRPTFRSLCLLSLFSPRLMERHECRTSIGTYEENELEVAGEVDLYIPWNKTKAVGTYVATGW